MARLESSAAMNPSNFVSDIRPLSLASYDCKAYGPLFAVSDEGAASQIIVDAAYSSAKARALWPLDPVDLGMALDGERMTSAGEVPIGPEEYEALSASAAGRLICTTNVGVRVNTRLNQQLPEFPVTASSATDPKWADSVVASFVPFLQTPDGHPRPLTVRLMITPDTDPGVLIRAVGALEKKRREGRLGPPDVHVLSSLIVFDEVISRDDQICSIKKMIEASVSAGLKEVSVDAELREAARRRLGIQSLLNVLDAQPLQQLLDFARRSGVRLNYRYQLDVDSAARTIWTGLHTARTNGFSAGKYGMVPMTLEEQASTVEAITRWTEGWTAIPAFYVDTPLLTAREVYDISRCEEAAMAWLKMARGGGAKIVLFDSPDRVAPRHLVREPNVSGDTGVLTLDAIERICEYAMDLGVSVLWSGGISGHQAYELSKRRVFGIFSTSSTATKIAVTAEFERDPRLAAQNEPTEFGVRRIHAVIQGGFLVSELRERDADLAKSIEAKTALLLEAGQDAVRSTAELARLDADLIRGWRLLHRTGKGAGDAQAAIGPAADPVPVNAVRVFRGRKRAVFDRAGFLNKLATVFMPMTIQIQRLYGLSAYLPAVPPASNSGILPDEVALVFYRTQNAYQESKRCIGGRAYSALHELVFDMDASRSEFPELFQGNVEFDKPYHLFNTSLDWQGGSTRLYLGTRLPEVSPAAFAEGIAKIASGLQQSRGDLDNVIFCVSEGWLIWWEHSSTPVARGFAFDRLSKAAFIKAARLLRVPTSLTRPYKGLTLNDAGDFVNFQFARR